MIATNLALLDDEVLEFCDRHDIYISTSLDGPADLHNRNRPRPGGNSWELAVDGIRRVRETLGAHRVSALMTTTERSLDRVREIIDCYLEQGLHRHLPAAALTVRLRDQDEELTPPTTSNAGSTSTRKASTTSSNSTRRGIPIVERYAALILKKMLTNNDPGYVDLTSPAGIGISVLVYNYDGDVYASDEARMLAEMRDTSFRLGNVHDHSWAELVLSDALLAAARGVVHAERSDVLRLRLRAATAAPTPSSTTQPVGDPVGRKPLSGVLPTQHGASSDTCSTATRAIAFARDLFQQLGDSMIPLRGRASSTQLARTAHAQRLAARRPRQHDFPSGTTAPS